MLLLIAKSSNEYVCFILLISLPSICFISLNIPSVLKYKIVEYVVTVDEAIGKSEIIINKNNKYCLFDIFSPNFFIEYFSFEIMFF